MSTELDNDFIPDREYPFRETLRWWERRRVWYNLVIVSMQALMIWDFWEAVLFVGFEYTIVLSLLYLFMANVSYCLGWGIEFLIAFYWKSNRSKPGLRRTLFILGVVFTIPCTYILYLDTYWYYLMESF